MEKMEHAVTGGNEQQEQVRPPPPPPQRVRVFPCRFRNKMFLSPRAMGGHHNAHRRERQAAGPSHSHKLVAVGQENLHDVVVLGPSPPLVYEGEEALSSSTSRPEPEPASSDDMDLSLRL
nr:protein LATE FLOWERING-like [Aegilops tauschii subsp. strangulata]